MCLKKTCGLLYAGIDNGAMLKIPGMGGPVPRQFGGAGEPGDLLLQVEVEPSPIFQREGNDVSVSRSIDFTDAILGRDLRCSPSHFSFSEIRAHDRARRVAYKADRSKNGLESIPSIPSR